MSRVLTQKQKLLRKFAKASTYRKLTLLWENNCRNSYFPYSAPVVSSLPYHVIVINDLLCPENICPLRYSILGEKKGKLTGIA